MNTVIDMAREILELHTENEFLKREVTRLEEFELKYHQLLDSSVKHGEQMMVGWLDLLLSDKVKIQP
jgi:hypothetical protein